MDGRFINGKIFVPNNLKDEIMCMLHEAQMGINKSQKRARDPFYWPGMNRDIEKIVSGSIICGMYSRENISEPLIPHNIPEFLF